MYSDIILNFKTLNITARKQRDSPHFEWQMSYIVKEFFPHLHICDPYSSSFGL